MTKFEKILHTLYYGIKHTNDPAFLKDAGMSRLALLMDFFKLSLRYNLWFSQYQEMRIYALDSAERKELLEGLSKENDRIDAWSRHYYANRKFLKKWGDIKYEASHRLQLKKRKAYAKFYGLGENNLIGYNVVFQRQHFFEGYLKTGKDCMILEDCSIDYTGGLTLGYKVSISEGCKILTHNHEMDFDKTTDDTKGCTATPLVIQDRAWLGARAIIMPGVKEIGRGAMISSDAYVRTKVPPYAIMLGNPAKVVGFRMSPEEIAAWESRNYPESERIPLETLEANYKKYFLDHFKEIKNYLSPIVK